MLTSCADEFDTSYQVQKPSSVTETEQLSSYGTLLQYVNPSFHLGNTLTASVFQAEGTAYTLTMANFNELTLSDAFLHSRLVGNDGSIDTTAIGSIASLAEEKGIGLFCTALCSSTDLNTNRLNTLIAPVYVELDETTGEDVWDFEANELGDSFAMKKSNGDEGKGTAVVENDPDGESGKVVHVTKTNQSFPCFTLTFPEGRKLGDYKKLILDFKANNNTAINQALVVTIAGKNVELKKPAEYGCQLNVWGRGLVEINLETLNFSEEQQQLATVEVIIGPKLLNCDYLIDNLQLQYTYKPSYYQEKTAEEKQQIVQSELQRYVAGVLGVSRSLDTWVVADRPVTSDSAMFWKSNLGETYFAHAARFARQENASARLFVSEQLDDADVRSTFLALLAKAEAEGAKIDGINAVLSFDAETFSSSNLSTLFSDLAATGKQVRLCIQSFYAADESSAATLLGNIVSTYLQKVPQPQRYGISFASVNESSTNAGLWTAGYNRRQTYASLADALQ